MPQSPLSPKYTELNHTTISLSPTPTGRSARPAAEAGHSQTWHGQGLGSSRGTRKALLLWVPGPPTVSAWHCPSLGYSHTFSHQIPALLSAKECHGYLSTQVLVNYNIKQKALYGGSPSHTEQHTVKSQPLCYFKKKGRHQHCQVKLSGTGTEN